MHIRLLLVTSIFALIVANPLSSQNHKSSERKEGVFKESELEALWRGKYAHCDYGFYVLLPDGFVAHSSPSGYSDAGFAVGLPDVGTTQPVWGVGVESQRSIWISAEHNSLEFKSLAEVTDHVIDLMKRRLTGFKLLTREAVRLSNRPAMRVKGEYDSPKGRAVEEEIIAFRSGMIYEAGLRTTPDDYVSDEPRFKQIVAGFRLWKVHHC